MAGNFLKEEVEASARSLVEGPLSSFLLHPPHLPSRKSVARLCDDLTALCFPGFFDDCTGCAGSEQGHAWVGERVAAVAAATQRAAEKCFRFSMHHGAKLSSDAGRDTREQDKGQEEEDDDDQRRHAKEDEEGNEEEGNEEEEWRVRATAAVRALLRQLPEVRRVIGTDIAAALACDPAARNEEEIVLSYPCVVAVSLQRIAHVLHTEGVPLLPRMMTERGHTLTGVDIHPGAAIGPHFFIDHGTGVVIGETARIGARVKIYQGVTIGAKSVSRALRERELDPGTVRQRHPTIEDDVTIYARATILGGDTVIGARTVVGGNVWCIESVPPDSVISYKEGSIVVRKLREDAVDWTI